RLAAEGVRPARRPGGLAWTHDASAFVDPHAGRDVDELKRGAHGVLRINQCRERGVRGVVPLAGCCFTADVLRSSDNLEVPIPQFRVDLLPAWQIESASSPG